MILPTDAAKPLPNIPSLTLQSVSTMGYNTTGRNTLLLINGNICKAIGNSVVYNSQIYRQHTY